MSILYALNNQVNGSIGPPSIVLTDKIYNYLQKISSQLIIQTKIFLKHCINIFISML